MRSNSDDNRIQGANHIAGLKLGQMDFVPADNYVVTKDHPPVLRATPAGAIDMLMPASGPDTQGLVFFIHNIGAGGIITLKTSGDAAFSPAITIAVSGGWVMVQCTGSATAASGWKLVASNLP